jgi:uncharacterized protein (DUF2062 family)/SAM-dependent methyltransferase
VTRDVLKTRLSGAWRRLRGGELTPIRAALSVAVGLAIGVTPAFGAHMFLVFAVCLPLSLDAPVSYLAANISIPPLAPFLWLAEVEIGAIVSTGHPLGLETAALRAMGPWAFAKELLLGTLLFAPTIAVLGGAVTYLVVSAVRAARPMSSFEAAVGGVAARYAKGRRSAYFYTRGKMLGDPVVRRLWELGAEEAWGEVSDVGAGRGQLGILLLESGLATKVTGLDWDTTKVRDARCAAEGLDATFEEGNVQSHPVPSCDTALLIDVLHYLTDAEQDAVLQRAVMAARQRVVIRDIDPDRGWRSGLTRLQESITTAVRFNRGARVHVRPIACIERVLRAGGLEVTVEPCWGETPFANVLVVGRRVRDRALGNT